jgi:hypothetical protein
MLVAAGWLLLVLAALVNAGCLLAVAGAAAGAAAGAGYVYYNGLLYRDYHASLSDSLLATRTALSELQFPIVEQKGDTGTAYLRTRTADGHTVRIYLDVVPSPIPIEGSLTRIGVRVGYSGDEAISARVLDQISRHLAIPSQIPQTTLAPANPNATLGTPRPIETKPPPLALAAPAALPEKPIPITPVAAKP